MTKRVKYKEILRSPVIRITIPKEFAEALDLRPGDTVRMELVDRKIIITKAN